MKKQNKNNVKLVLDPAMMENKSSNSHTAGIIRNTEEAAIQDEDYSERLNIRRKCELELIKKFDKSEINIQKECWYLMDSNWLNSWAAFTSSEECGPPGKVSSAGLLDENNKPLSGLTSRCDYRGVPPLVYYIFVTLYGRDSSPNICRYTIDIYQPEVPMEHIINMQLLTTYEANVQVSQVSHQWIKWERKYEEDEDDEVRICCGTITKAHIEAWLYWGIACCITCFRTRKSKARKDIKYSQYQPLNAMSDSMHSNPMHGNSSHGSSHGSSRSNTSHETNTTRVKMNIEKDYDQNSWLRNLIWKR